MQNFFLLKVQLSKKQNKQKSPYISKARSVPSLNLCRPISELIKDSNQKLCRHENEDVCLLWLEWFLIRKHAAPPDHKH